MPADPSPARRSSFWQRRSFNIIIFLFIGLILYRRLGRTDKESQEPNLAPLASPVFPCVIDDPIRRVAIIGTYI